MTIKNFINELENALNGELPKQEIQKHIDYYENYLKVKAVNCSEEEAVEMLGSPNLIAKTLINDYKMTHESDLHYSDNAAENQYRDTADDTMNQNESSYEADEGYYKTDDSKRERKIYKNFKLNHKLLSILGIVIPIILFIVIFFVGRILFRYFIPIIIIVILIYTIAGIFRRK